VLGVNRTIYNSDRSYNSFLSLAAHEYIHLWLVKRLKPAALEDINYDVEMYTDLLWVMEGLTSYFEEKVMLRCGFFDKHQFLSNLLSTMARIKNTPGAEVQSLTEASFDAWIKYYRRNENSDNTQISYYSKGLLVGALLDLQIINSTEGERSLDDVINALYYKFYKKKGRGITNSDFQKMAEEISGVSLDDFFNAYVYGTAPLDNERFLHFAGIGLVEINKQMSSRAIGITLEQVEGNMEIAAIKKGSSAYENGLSVGDEIIAIDGVRVNLNNIQSVVDQFEINDTVKVLIARDGLVEEKEVEIRRNDAVAYTYEMLDNKTRKQHTVYNKWLAN
jgi:predicted metalloprotease with PDZ domain